MPSSCGCTGRGFYQYIPAFQRQGCRLIIRIRHSMSDQALFDWRNWFFPIIDWWLNRFAIQDVPCIYRSDVSTPNEAFSESLWHGDTLTFTLITRQSDAEQRQSPAGCGHVFATWHRETRVVEQKENCQSNCRTNFTPQASSSSFCPPYEPTLLFPKLYYFRIQATMQNQLIHHASFIHCILLIHPSQLTAHFPLFPWTN